MLIVSNMQALQEQLATNHKHNLEYLLGVHWQPKQLTCPEIAVVSRMDHSASNYNAVSLLAPHMILLSTELNTMWILQL